MVKPGSDPERLFLLSPASCSGERARLLLRPQASFPLATRIRTGKAPLGEVFTFTSGLYFRGKLAYATAFARVPAGVPGTLVITPSWGLVPPDTPVDRDDLLAFAEVPVDLVEPRYRGPLDRDASALARFLPEAEVVLLGSIASGKYVDALLALFGERLLFPEAFVGRGDLSRGGLLLRSVEAGEELAYVKVAGATRRGPRPPRLPRKTH